MLKENSKAPDFSLADKDGNMHSLKDVNSKYVLIYFYPTDNTPGCTIEAIEFTKALPELELLGVTVFGITGGNKESKTKFCKDHNLKVILLSDTDFSISKKYGVYGEKSFMGRTYLGIRRITFLLNKEHRIIKVFDTIKPAIHAQEIIEYIKSY